MLRICLFFCFFFSISTPAIAKWHTAESDHFVIYANQSEKEVRAFAERLERFHAAMSITFGRKLIKPSPSNRVTVFVVGSYSNVRKLAGKNAKQVAGFYRPRAGGTLAVVPRLRKSRSSRDFSGETVLLHEYAHHYMYNLTSFSWPRWFSEGFAEFYGSAKFFADGAVGLGAPANHRAREFAYGRPVPIHLLFDTKGYQESKRQRYDSFYAQSWLLFHYLTFSTERSGQFSRYQKLLIEGTDELVAAQTAFGDLKKLNRELNSYRKKRKLSYRHLTPDKLKTGTVTVRQLRPGEAAIMPLMVRSKRGVNKEEAEALLPEIKAVALRHPSDPMVQGMLAEAEFDVGHFDAAIAAANQALANDPKTVNAYVQKGYALAAKARDAENPDALWKEARNTFVALNRFENDHPIPLIWFFRTYVEQGKQPTKLAVEGLEWALQLAPYDQSLRVRVAQQQISDSRLEQAIITLRPLANSPHENKATRMAEELINTLQERLEKKQVSLVIE